jgi:aminopeptidase N
MRSWTTQMGYPVLKVTGSTFSGSEAKVTLAQSWFLADGSDVKADEAKLWCVPILTATKAGVSDDISMMREDAMEITVPIAGAGDWVKLNASQQVPMRVLYDDAMMER